MSTVLTCWRFHAVDSWFFRETRSYEAVGVSELASVFPPPSRTLMGAIRSWLGDRLGVDWQAFSRGQAPIELQELLGDAEHPGRLCLAAVTIRWRGQTLWPCPADVMRGPSCEMTRLLPGTPVVCDLGRVRLPSMVAGAPAGSKTLDGAWLTERGAAQWLLGQTPEPNEIVTLDDLLVEEPRLGIARDRDTATVRQGMLYQSRHLRLRDPDTCVEAWITGLPDAVLRDVPLRQTLRLGGEGRMADVSLTLESEVPLPAASAQGNGRHLALWAVSPLRLEDAEAQAGLPGFVRTTAADGIDCWEGELHGVALRLLSSCRPRAYREGGWDQRRHRPKAVRSYLAPGSVLFCEVLGDMPMREALRRLHGCQAGADAAWGMGLLLAAPSDGPVDSN